MRPDIVRAIIFMLGVATSSPAVAQVGAPPIAPEIIIKDTTSLWSEADASWKFSARISFFHPPAISGGKDITPAPPPTDDGIVLPEIGDDPLRPPADAVIRPPELISATVLFARHVYPAEGAHEAFAQFTLVPPWPLTTGVSHVTILQPKPLPPINLDELRDESEVEAPLVGVAAPPTADNGANDGRQVPKRGPYLNADAVAMPVVPGSSATRGDSLFWQWKIIWRDRAGVERTTLSARQRLVVDCTADDTARDLMRLQARALAYDQPALVVTPTGGPLGISGAKFNRNLVADGIVTPPHLAATITGNGFTLARVEAVQGLLVPAGILVDPEVSLKPTLVFYEPGRLPGEPLARHIPRISEREFLDPPYRMIGFAFAQPHIPQVSRPSLGCVPSENWFIHEAGWHLTDGGFRPTPPREIVRGERRLLDRSEDPAARIRQKGDLMWHGRIWDMHFWFDPACPDRSCPPIVSIFAPFPVLGLTLPEPLFFKSEVFE